MGAEWKGTYFRYLSSFKKTQQNEPKPNSNLEAGHGLGQHFSSKVTWNLHFISGNTLCLPSVVFFSLQLLFS